MAKSGPSQQLLCTILTHNPERLTGIERVLLFPDHFESVLFVERNADGIIGENLHRQRGTQLSPPASRTMSVAVCGSRVTSRITRSAAAPRSSLAPGRSSSGSPRGGVAPPAIVASAELDSLVTARLPLSPRSGTRANPRRRLPDSGHSLRP